MNKEKVKVLVAGSFPPPLYGSALMNEYVYRIESEIFSFDKFIINFNDNPLDVEKFKLRKIILFFVKLFHFYFRIKEYDILIYTHSFRKIAFLKDLFFIFCALIRKKKVVLFAQGNGFDKNIMSFSKLSQNFIFKLLLSISGVVTVSKKIRKEYYKYLDKDNIVSIYNYYDFTEYPTVLPKKFNDLKFTVLFLSSITRQKGIYTLIEVIKAVLDRYEFIIAGGFTQKKEEKEIRNLLKGYKNVKIFGRVESEEKIKLFLNSDIFMFPSLNDSFGLVLLEAMYFGLPIITTPQGAITEYFIDGKNGFIVPENDTNAFIQSLDKLSQDKSLYESISRFNIEYVKNNFTKKIFDKSWINFLRKIYEF